MRSTTLILACAAVAVTSPARADVATDWWDVANRYYNAAQGSPAPLGPDTARASTRAALAIFEAVNAIDRRYQNYLAMPAGDPTASQDAAAATAGFKVLLHHYPANKAALEESYALTMAGLADSPGRQAGVAIGDKAAALAIAAGGLDQSIVQTPYRPRSVAGEWVATALPSLDPYWQAMKPWVIPNAAALRPPPPPALTSDVYARDVEEVRRLGGRTSIERTPVQTLIARYRQAFDVTSSVRIATDAPGRRAVDNARLLALYQMAFDDAAQAMIVAKQHYDYWRPITAIRNADRDGNPATQVDSGWLPLLPTPNFQEYPCGHCTVAAAIGEVMERESGLPASAGVTVASLINSNSTTQHVASWDEWVLQVSDSRIYGGVHYRFSNEAGEDIGRKAAAYVVANALRPLPKARRK